MTQRPTVLIIVPRPNIRTMLEMMLSHEGLRVFSAVSVSSALLQLRVWQPDVIIMDCDMQALEAHDAVAQITAASRSPLLLLGDHPGLASGAGRVAVLPCPIHAGQLCARIAALITPGTLPDSTTLMP